MPLMYMYNEEIACKLNEWRMVRLITGMLCNCVEDETLCDECSVYCVDCYIIHF